MEQKSTKKNMILVIIPGILGSLFFIFLGYWIAGGIGYMQSDGVNFLTGFNRVMGAPFAAYFNNYTPILVALFFILFELFFFLLLVSMRRSARVEEYDYNVEENVMKSAIAKTGNDLFDDIVTAPRSEESIKEDTADLGVVLPENNHEDLNIIKDMTQEEQVDEVPESTPEVKKAVFNDDIAMELLGEYTLDQVAAMLDISKYMEVSSDILRSMFKPSMEAEEIKEYIEMFFE